MIDIKYKFYLLSLSTWILGVFTLVQPAIAETNSNSNFEPNSNLSLTPIRAQKENFDFTLSQTTETSQDNQAPTSGANQAPTSSGAGSLGDKVQNPVGALISVPFKFTFDFGAPDGSAFILNTQPVIPVTVGDWNLINRAIIPFISTSGSIQGIPEIPEVVRGDGSTGLGDINYSLFVSPAEPGKIIWGVGPSIGLPTATSDQLGSGKWTAGPTAVVLTQPKPWTFGVLARQLWSYAGDSDRDSVSQFLVEPFINYNLSNGWYLLTDLIITANWNADSDNVWTLPLGGGAGKLINIGKQPANIKTELYYNAVRPDSAPEWVWSTTFQLLFPK